MNNKDRVVGQREFLAADSAGGGNKREEEKDRTFIQAMSDEILRLPEFYNFIEGLKNESPLSKETAVGLLDKLGEYKFLSKDNFTKLRDVLRLSGPLKHDLNNLTTEVYGYLDILQKDLRQAIIQPETTSIPASVQAEIINALAVVRRGLPACVAVLEDIFARRALAQEEAEEDDFFTKHQRPVNLRMLEYVVERLSLLRKDEFPVGEKLKKEFHPSDLLRHDEMVRAVPGVLANFLAEAARNAARENGQHQSTQVVLQARREDGELVLRVMDDGGGMSREMILADGAQSVWQEGVSYSDSSGYGLSRAPEKIEKSGGLLVCYSRRPSETGGDGQWHRSDEDSQAFAGIRKAKQEEMTKIVKAAAGKSFSPSTIMEIRLPIIKKAK